MHLFAIFLFVCHVTAIWPAPQSFTYGSSVVWVKDDNLSVIYNGRSVRWFPNSSYVEHSRDSYESQTELFFAQLPISNSSSNSQRFSSQVVVSFAVGRALKTIFSEKFIPWKLHPRNHLASFEPAASDKRTYVKILSITQTIADNATSFKPLAGQVDESYTLAVAEDGSASLTANSYIGILRGLETFTQLFYTHSSGSGIYSNLAPIKIIDKPKFPHRGLNLDVSRNWFPKEDILRTIDALAWNKFSRLHIHMTDSQSWPLDVPALPALSQKGAYQTGLSYSPNDLEAIQIYAIYRGVEVIVELDMPGHTTAIGLAYPDLVAAADATPWDSYCAEPPCGTLKLNSPAVNTFVETLLSDVIPRVSPYSAYFHTGGDEVNANAYTLDETVNSSSTSVLTPLLQKFVDRNHKQLRAAGLAPIVWEEMLLEWGLTLGDDVVVQTWMDEDSLSKATAAGHKALFGNYGFWVGQPSHGIA
jgi:hexosaminidase